PVHQLYHLRSFPLAAERVSRHLLVSSKQPPRSMANMTGYTRILDPPTTQKAWKDIYGHAYYEKQTNVDKLVKKLKEATVEDFERKFDICLWYIYTTFDIISDLTFVSKQDLYSGAYVTGLLNTGSSALSWSKFCANYIDVRLTKDQENTRPDFWSLVLRQKEEDRLSLAEMYTNSSAFMIAGTETTATLLSGLTYYLLKNPDQMEKLATEICGSFQSEEEMIIGAL
ncbi:cytochrome P450, partial [Hyaloscypha finlandica]